MEYSCYHETANYKCLQGLEHQSSDLFLAYCGVENCLPLHEYGSIRRREHLIHFVLQGTGTFTFHGKSRLLSRGQAFYVPPDDAEYYYIADAKDPWSYSWIGFDGTMATHYLEQTALSVEQPVCEIGESAGRIADVIRQMLDAYTLTPANEIRRVAYLYRILALLTDAAGTAAPRRSFAYAPEAYAKYAHLLIEHSYAEYAISDIIRIVGIDRSYLYTLFRKEYHISPQRFLIRCRLGAAAASLLDTSESVQQIAQEVGYQDALNFSRLFKYHYGVSPTQYRAGLRAKEEAFDAPE